jgi:hypothetical protein
MPVHLQLENSVTLEKKWTDLNDKFKYGEDHRNNIWAI